PETQDSRLPVSNVCPHCQTLVPVKQEHMYMRTRKLACPNCKKPFRPGGPWPADDPELPTAKQASEKFELGRNFANKLWNAARFLLLNLEGYTPGSIRMEELPIEDRWILSRLATTAAAITEQLEGFHFSEAARTIYDFTWSEFSGSWRDAAMEKKMGRMQDLVRAIREVRNRYTVDARTRLDVSVRGDAAVIEDFRLLAPFITSLANVGRLESDPGVTKPAQS